MQIKSLTYDHSTGEITLQGSATAEDAVAFLVGGRALASASTADAEAAVAPAKPSKGSAKPAKAAPTKPAKAAEADEDDEDDDDDEDDTDDDEDDSDDEDEAPAKAAKPAGKTQLKITPAMKKASKLREVIEALMEQGVSKKDMVAACTALKDKVPVLGRVADLDARVPKAYEMITSK